MKHFELSDAPLDLQSLRAALNDAHCGAFAAFEGWVRDHNEGRAVARLEYEACAPVAMTEAQRILDEAAERFAIQNASCVHRTGLLEIGDCAVWVGVSSAHRDAAFLAARYIIDEIKARLPIWKKEHYVAGDAEWVNCQHCAPGHGH